MAKFKLIIATVLLIAALVLLVDVLLSTQPIQIVLESGQEVTSEESNYFAISEVLLLIISAFIIGASTIYLYYNSEVELVKKIKRIPDEHSHILPLLKEDEKKVFLVLKNSNGEMLQNAIVAKTQLSKVKVTRVLARLEKKDLIIRQRHGLTNKILLK